MLKSAIYMNVFILLLMSIIYLRKAFDKKIDLKKLRQLMCIYLLYNFTSIYLYNNDIVDIDWDFIFLHPISAISLLIYIIGICISSVKIKKSAEFENRHFGLKKYIAAIFAPIFIFTVPYAYELNILNRCDYLLKYNYQGGMITSEDTYIAFVNNKPKTVTLQKNLYDRKGISVDYQKYHIIFNDDIEISIRDSKYNKIITENEEIKNIALNIREKHPTAKGAYAQYFPEKGYTVIELLAGESSGTVLGEYFCYNDKYISIYTNGNLESVTYYE